MIRLFALALSVAFSFVLSPVFAMSYSASVPAAAQRAEWVRGEVVKVDRPRLHVVLQHEAIASIGMTAMTMPFKVAKPGLLRGLKPGDVVRFQVKMQQDELLLVKLEVRK